MKRDRRRWTAADSDGDDKLTKEEFASFLHPEESEHMRDIVVQETMEDIDKNSDGQVRFVDLMFLQCGHFKLCRFHWRSTLVICTEARKVKTNLTG